MKASVLRVLPSGRQTCASRMTDRGCGRMTFSGPLVWRLPACAVWSLRNRRGKSTSQFWRSVVEELPLPSDSPDRPIQLRTLPSPVRSLLLPLFFLSLKRLLQGYCGVTCASIGTAKRKRQDDIFGALALETTSGWDLQMEIGKSTSLFCFSLFYSCPSSFSSKRLSKGFHDETGWPFSAWY